MSGFGLPIDVARELSFSPLGIAVSLRNARSVQAVTRNGASGQTLLYSCPAGKKALVAGIVCFNATAGAVTVRPMFRTGGTTYNYFSPAPGVSLAAGAQTTFANAFIVMDANDQLYANNGALGPSWWARIIEFDAGQTNVKSIKFLNLVASGDNTIYTCPAGKRAQILPFTPRSDQLGGLMIYQSGSTRTINIHQPTAGSTVSAATNKCAATGSVVNDDVVTFTIPGTLDANESIVLNSDAAASLSLVHMTVIEH